MEGIIHISTVNVLSHPINS